MQKFVHYCTCDSFFFILRKRSCRCRHEFEWPCFVVCLFLLPSPNCQYHFSASSSNYVAKTHPTNFIVGQIKSQLLFLSQCMATLLRFQSYQITVASAPLSLSLFVVFPQIIHIMMSFVCLYNPHLQWIFRAKMLHYEFTCAHNANIWFVRGIRLEMD